MLARPAFEPFGRFFLAADSERQRETKRNGSEHDQKALSDDVAETQLIKRDQNVQQRISDLSEPAKRLLAEVEVNGAASPSDRALLTTLGWTRSRASQVFRELEQGGLVRPLERPGTRGRPRRLYEVTY